MKRFVTAFLILISGGLHADLDWRGALIEPADHHQTFSANPHFDWNDVGGDEYEIHIASDSEFTNIVDRDVIHSFVHRYVPADRLVPGSYWWRVRGIMPDRTASSWSAVRKLTILAPEVMYQVHIPAGSNWADIQNLVASARSNAPARIVFASNTTYVLDQDLDSAAQHPYPSSGENYCIDLSKTTNILVEGNHATLQINKASPPASFFFMKDAGNIVIRDFTLRHTRPGFSVMRVTGVNTNAGTFDGEILPQFASCDDFPEVYDSAKSLNTSLYNSNGVFKIAPFQLRCSGLQRLTSRTLRMTLDTKAHAAYMTLGDLWLCKYNPGKNSVSAYTVNDLTLDHITVDSGWGTLGMGVFVAGNYVEKLKILNCNSDMMFNSDERIGYWVENCYSEFCIDDLINTRGANRLEVETIDESDRRKFTTVNQDWAGLNEFQSGDLLQFYDGIDIIHEGTVASIVQNGSTAEVQLASVLPGTVTTNSAVFNNNRNCPRFVYRNSTCVNSKGAVLLLCADGALIENVTMIGTGETPVSFNSPRDKAGLVARNIMFRNNRIIRNAVSLTAAEAPMCGGITSKFRPSVNRYHNNIHILNNEITGYSDQAFSLENTERVYIRGNRITSGDQHDLAAWNTSDELPLIALKHTTDIFFEDNVFRDHRARTVADIALDDAPDFYTDNTYITSQLNVSNVWKNTGSGVPTIGNRTNPGRSLSEITLGAADQSCAVEVAGNCEIGAYVSGAGGVSIGSVQLTGTNGWLRLARRGDRFMGFYSGDGTVWTQVLTETAALTDPVDAGLFTAGSAVFDSVTITLPASAGRTYESWVVANRLVGETARSDDPDGDGMDNLLEYALGGDPNVPDADLIKPKLFAGGAEPGKLVYGYRRRRDAAECGLSCVVKVTDDLVAALWTNLDMSAETGVEILDMDFEWVLNQFQTDADHQFMTLEVKESQ